MRHFLFLALIALHATCSAQQVWTNCVTAKKYERTIGESYKEINKPFEFCWNDKAFGFLIDKEMTIIMIDHYDKGVSKINPPYVQEEFSAKEFASDPFPSYIVIVTYSKPAQVTINYTRFGGQAYNFYVDNLPVITETIEKPIDYGTPVYDKYTKYPNSNEVLNPGLSLHVKEGNAYPVWTTPNMSKEAISSVSIKKYFKSKIPSLNKNDGEISLGFEILPNGKTIYRGGGYDPDLSQKRVAFLEKEIEKATAKMPLWKIADDVKDPIKAFIDITF